MQARVDNPVLASPEARQALQQLNTAAHQLGAGIPETTFMLVTLRASQINGCSVCVDMHTRELKAAGESETRIFTVAAWRDTPYFSDAERAALALAEAATRLADRADPVPDEIWAEAARHYNDRQLGALVLCIAGINTWNRINITTRQPTGEWIAQWLPSSEGAA